MIEKDESVLEDGSLHWAKERQVCMVPESQGRKYRFSRG